MNTEIIQMIKLSKYRLGKISFFGYLDFRQKSSSQKMLMSIGNILRFMIIPDLYYVVVVLQ